MADIEITRADRDAAVEEWRGGSLDELAKAFAAHRLSAKLEAEREIVSWLRGLHKTNNGQASVRRLADAIERGDSRKAE